MSALAHPAPPAPPRPARLKPVFVHAVQQLIAAPSAPNQRWSADDQGTRWVFSPLGSHRSRSVRVMRFADQHTCLLSVADIGINIDIALDPRGMRQIARILLDAAYDIDGHADDAPAQPAQVPA